jgi:hypothetical protein
LSELKPHKKEKLDTKQCMLEKSSKDIQTIFPAANQEKPEVKYTLSKAGLQWDRPIEYNKRGEKMKRSVIFQRTLECYRYLMKNKVLYEKQKEYLTGMGGKAIYKTLKMQLKHVWKGFFYVR